MREEAKERDHRKLGKELDLFMISQEVGQGLPFWLPNGATIRRELERYIVDKEVAAGYQHVYTTPPIASVELYKTSGHWDHYREDMFPTNGYGGWGRICSSSNELSSPHRSLQTPCALLPRIANPYR